ncbi:MAG: NAD(P)H-dependent oxidoreductase, partial [Candidatus Nanopelagicales bacterium]
MTQIRIVAIGGSTREESSTELALRIAGRAAERAGAHVTYVTGPDLILPMYDINDPDRQPVVKDFIESVRQADGLILASPGYHGGMSGLFKNAMDYLEDLREDERPYLHNRAVGCIST